VTNKADVNVCNRFGHSPLFTASENGHCDIVKYLVAHNADVNLTDRNNKSPLYSAAEMGHYDIVLFLLQKGADVNISDVNKKSSLYVASSSGHFTIIKLLIAHGALSAGNAKSQFKTISKRTNGNEIFSDSNALLNPCRYPEEKISRSKEKQEEEKEGIYVAKAQEGKEETVFTREQEEKEENEETIDRRKEQVEKGELVSTRKGEEEIVEVDDLFSFPLSCGGDALLPDDGNTSPLSIAVQKGHFDIVKYIIENSTDFDLSDTGKSPLFLAAEEG
jgi:ankyrin repeat protein